MKYRNITISFLCGAALGAGSIYLLSSAPLVIYPQVECHEDYIDLNGVSRCRSKIKWFSCPPLLDNNCP